MWRAELRSVFRRTRVRILLVVLGALPLLLAATVAVSGGPEAGKGPTFLDRVDHNGVYLALAALTISVPFLLPLAVAVVAGDAVAGEASLGTLRYLLARPTGRVRLLLVKGAAVAVFCVVAALAIVVIGLVAGIVIFPRGAVDTLSGTTLPFGDGVLRVLAAAALVGTSLFGLGAVGVFASTLTDVPVGAMAATIGLVVVSTALDSVPELAPIHPWLLTHQWQSFADLFRSPVSWHGIVRNLILQGAYVAVFATAAWSRFTTRDVLA
jgi:ABC-2 type transport system permease protein